MTLVRDPRDEERRLEAQRRAAIVHYERRVAARTEVLRRQAAAEAAGLSRARRTLAHLLGARTVRAALVVGRSLFVRRRPPQAVELLGSRATMGEALWGLRVTRALARSSTEWLGTAREGIAGRQGRPMTVVIGGRRTTQTGVGLAVVIHGSLTTVARTLRRARGISGPRALVIARPGRRPTGAAVVRTALGMGADVVLLLGSPSAASAGWESACAALDRDPHLAAVSAGRGWWFDHDRGVTEPIPADADAGHAAAAVDDAALLLRRDALRAHLPATEGLRAGWALDWSLRLLEHGLRIEARGTRGAPDGVLPPEDVQRLRRRWGPTLRRRVLEDLLAGGGRWCARGARVSLGPGAGPLAGAASALGWTVVSPAQADFVLTGELDGRVLVTWPASPNVRSGGVEVLPPGSAPGCDATMLAAALRASVSRPAFRVRIWPRDWSAAVSSGDLPFAEGLAGALRDLGHQAQVELLGSSDPSGEGLDVSLTLRGRRPAPEPASGQLDLVWLMSHPAEVEDCELERYDAVLVASRPYARLLADRLRVPVRTFLQCTNPEHFSPQPGHAPAHEVLFVGNWRSEFRPIVWDLLPTDADLALYGSGWNLLAPHHVRGERVDPEMLPALYSSCAILLNDHWDDMRSFGFISNRIFDALACEAFVISDPVIDVEDELDGGLAVYHDRAELRELVGRYLADGTARRAVARRGRAAVLRAHTTAHRARELADLVNELGQRRGSRQGIPALTPDSCTLRRPRAARRRRNRPQ